MRLVGVTCDLGVFFYFGGLRVGFYPFSENLKKRKRKKKALFCNYALHFSLSPHINLSRAVWSVRYLEDVEVGRLTLK